MAQFFKFKFLIAFKLIFDGGGHITKKYQKMVISESRKSHNKIVKFKVENFEH